MRSLLLRALTATVLAAALGTFGCAETTTSPPESMLTTISVALSAATIEVGQNASASAAGFDQNGAPTGIGTVTWSSGSSTVATISAGGVVTGVAPGQVLVVATAAGRMGQQLITVTPVAVATVAISPATATVANGATWQLIVTTTDAMGNTLTGRAAVWSSSATSVVTVSASGLATAVGPGTATVSATSEGKIGSATVTVTSTLGVGLGLDQFSLIPASTFQMGSTNGLPSEQPVHAVTISRAFYLQKTEVTQGQWQAVMGSNPSYFSNCGLSCPVESVSRDDIQAFIAQLNASSGVTYRLPTEAEWEYAARAGTTGETYGALDSIAWHPGNAGGGTHPSAGKQANAWGLYDMIGNVFEWVNDWFAAYSSTPVTDPTGPATGSDVAERGGGWYAGYLGQTPWRYIVWARAAARGRSSPASRSFELGFRLARTP